MFTEASARNYNNRGRLLRVAAAADTGTCAMDVRVGVMRAAHANHDRVHPQTHKGSTGGVLMIVLTWMLYICSGPK